MPLVRQVLQAQEYWRLKGLSADVVIVNEHPVSYLDEMQAAAHRHPRRRAVERLAAPAGRRLPAAGGPHGPRRARAARSGGARDSPRRPRRPPERSSIGPMPVQPPAPAARADRAAARRAGDANAPVPAVDAAPTDSGGFADEGARTRSSSTAPAKRRCRGRTSSPTRASAPSSRRRASAHTWSGNSRENRLTPFANDPVSDPTAEAIFVRDDETGESWSPTPGPDAARPGEPADRWFATRPALTHFSRADARHRPRAGRLRRHRRSGEVLAAHAGQRAAPRPGR